MSLRRFKCIAFNNLANKPNNKTGKSVEKLGTKKNQLTNFHNIDLLNAFLNDAQIPNEANSNNHPNRGCQLNN